MPQPETTDAGSTSETRVLPERKRSTRSVIAVLVVAGVAVTGLGLFSAAPTTSPPSETAAPVPSSNAPPKRPAASATQQWSTENSAYWVGKRRKSVAFELPAENTVAVWMRTVRPALVVRCMERRTEVFVVTESALKIEPQNDDHTVTIAFDDDADVSEQWPDSEEHDALFARDGAAFAARLARARMLRFGYTPHNAAGVVAQFNVAGLTTRLARAAGECGLR